jgi:hypothetical protein
MNKQRLTSIFLVFVAGGGYVVGIKNALDDGSTLHLIVTLAVTAFILFEAYRREE